MKNQEPRTKNQEPRTSPHRLFPWNLELGSWGLGFGICSFFLLSFSFIYGQDTLVSAKGGSASGGKGKKAEQRIELLADVFLNSNTITNDFIWAFYNGKFIDDELKQNAAKNILSVNRLGAASKLGITYSYTPFSLQSFGGEGQGGAFSFSFFDRQNLDIKFSDDLFYTVFYGNEPLFAGETAHLGNFQLNLLRYQQFRFGWDWKGDARYGAYGFAFSLLSGEQNIFIKANRADLFTSSDGRYIDFSLAMNLQQTDTARKKYFAQNGMGLSADFFYEMPYTVWKEPGKITFAVSDFGFIRWNSNSMHFAVDSSYHYDGIDTKNLFNTDSFPQFSIDSVIDRNTKFQRKQYNTYLPFTFDIHTKTFYGKQFAFEKGIVFWFNTSAKPYYYAKLHFIIGRKKSADIAYALGYGGYGRFNAGLELKIDFAKHYSLHLVDNYLFSGITAQSTTGMGVYLKLVRKF